MSKIYAQKKPHETAGVDSAHQAAPAFSNQAMLDLLKAPENVRAKPLSQEMHEKMSQHFGVSLSGVKVFENENLNQLGETAFAHGNEIHVAKGQYAPGTAHGQEVLMHEAAHVVQQGMGLTHGMSGESAALEAQAQAVQAGGSMGNLSGFSMPTATASAPVQGFGRRLLKKLKGLFQKKTPAPQPAPDNNTPKITFNDLAAPAMTKKEQARKEKMLREDAELFQSGSARGNYFMGDYEELSLSDKVRAMRNMAYSYYNDQHRQYVRPSEIEAYSQIAGHTDQSFVDELFRQRVEASNGLEKTRQKYMKKGKSEEEIQARILLSKEGIAFSSIEDLIRDLALLRTDDSGDQVPLRMQQLTSDLKIEHPEQLESLARFTGYFSNIHSNISDNAWIQSHSDTVKKLNKKALKDHAKIASKIKSPK